MIKLRDLAERLSCRLDGDGDIEIKRVAPLDGATPGDITFFANPKYLSLLTQTRASAVILRPDAPDPPCAALRVENPYLAFARALRLFVPTLQPVPGVHEFSEVAANVKFGKDVSIGAFVVIGESSCVGDRTTIGPNTTIGPGVVIGNDCLIHSNVAVRESVTIGDRVVIQNGAIIGSDGYGFVRRDDGTHEKIPQVAKVFIEDDVELGANTTVDRPSLGETRIKAGTKIDNLVQIGHGVTVGHNVLMAAQVGIAGSTTIGDDVMFGGQVGVGGHLKIGDRSVAVGQSGVTHSIDSNSEVAGYPAIESKEWRRAVTIFRRLPELKRRIEELEAQLEKLRNRTDSPSGGTLK